MKKLLISQSMILLIVSQFLAALLGKAPLGKGSASFTTSLLKVGTHSIKATYPGNANFTTSKSSALKQVVQ